MKTPFHMIIFKTYHAQRNANRFQAKSFKLSPGQPKVLRYIYEHEYCMLKDIAEDCDVESATISKLLHALEISEMIIRDTLKSNKRALCLQITPKGIEALRIWDTHCQEVETKALTGFSEEEKEQFKDYLCRMYYNLSGKNIV